MSSLLRIRAAKTKPRKSDGAASWLLCRCIHPVGHLPSCVINKVRSYTYAERISDIRIVTGREGRNDECIREWASRSKWRTSTEAHVPATAATAATAATTATIATAVTAALSGQPGRPEFQQSGQIVRAAGSCFAQAKLGYDCCRRNC